MSNNYQIIDHTADLGLHVFGSNPEDLFATAARAMFEIIADIESVKTAESLTLRVQGADWPDLMVNWLRELLYLWSGKELMVSSTQIMSLSDREIKAIVGTEPFDPDRHRIRTEIKAVTYHQIRVDCRSTGWQARIIFDV